MSDRRKRIGEVFEWSTTVVGLEKTSIEAWRGSVGSSPWRWQPMIPSAMSPGLGHTQVQTTARYAHLARDTVKASAARIGDSIERDLGAEETSAV